MRFAKMQGVGNDFVVVDTADLPADTDWTALARTLCERRFGVGADGLLALTHGTGTDALSFRMFNPDGSEDMCGNGLRCAGLYALHAGWLNRQSDFTARTKDGTRQLQLLSTNENHTEALLSVDMGRPQFAPATIPFAGSDDPVILFPLVVEGETFSITAINTGSTHTVIFTDENGVDEATFLRISPCLENHPFFPERTSVLWATPTGTNEVRVRIWERGAGETLGCGTGACAVAVATKVLGRVGKGPVHVISRGGTLSIDWLGKDADMVMTGPAVLVYEGNCPPLA